jgi:hypothetical protein
MNRRGGEEGVEVMNRKEGGVCQLLNIYIVQGATLHA